MRCLCFVWCVRTEDAGATVPRAPLAVRVRLSSSELCTVYERPAARELYVRSALPRRAAAAGRERVVWETDATKRFAFRYNLCSSFVD